MNDLNELSTNGEGGEKSEASSNIFLNMAQTDSTGIPSLKQAPVSAISSSASDSKVSAQLIIALCVMVIGGGAIYGMRYIGMQAGLDESIVSIDYASDANTEDFTQRFASVMKTLDESSVSVQIADSATFASQPFLRPDQEIGAVAKMDPGMSEEERMAAQREYEQEQEIARRHEMVMDEVDRFKLQGIIGGSRPAARISGMPVRAGMKLGEYFTVIEITGRSVVIEGDGMRFELALGEDAVQLD